MPLTFFYGTMNSGKSVQLLCKLHHNQQNGKLCYSMKSSIDTRNGNGVIFSRINGLSKNADYVFKPNEKLNLDNAKFDYLFIDESQFMTIEQAEELVRFSLKHEKIEIYCYGLLSDFQPRLFGSSRIFLTWADKSVEIESKCKYCDRNSKFNLKINNTDDNKIDLGAEEKYVGVCSQCFIVHRSVQVKCFNNDDFIIDAQFSEVKITLNS